jgi:hypothetical protein
MRRLAINWLFLGPNRRTLRVYRRDLDEGVRLGIGTDSVAAA